MIGRISALSDALPVGVPTLSAETGRTGLEVAEMAQVLALLAIEAGG